MPVNKFSYLSSFFNLPLNDQNTYKVAKPGPKAPTVSNYDGDGNENSKKAIGLV